MSTAMFECETEHDMFAGGQDAVLTAEPEGAFDELRSTLAGALDVRDVFQRLSAVVGRIVAHDEAHLALRTDDATQFRLYASTHEGKWPSSGSGNQSAVGDPSVPRVFHDRIDGERGFRSGVRVPVLVEGETIAVLILISRRRRFYSDHDVSLAQSVAHHIAIAISHQRLAEAARKTALERDRAANLESSIELLRTISGVLDVRSVFPRISEIANKVLPHDRMTLSFDDRRGEIIMQAASNRDFAHVDRIRLVDDQLQDPGNGFVIVDDLLHGQSLPIAEPADLQDRMRAAGYRSFLFVNRTAGHQVIGLEFWSKRSNAFHVEDVPTARRIADHVALAISHEGLAEAAQRTAEIRAREGWLKAGARSLAEARNSMNVRGLVVGRSRAWNDVLDQAAKVASTETTVLLTGESGTGKEVVARLIHRSSARKTGPFVALNCAAMPDELLESELFGYERGAFTGAQQSKPGQIELASAGVLFLDEVSEMSLSAQAKFLRMLQEREFRRLGGTRLLRANIRVIAATNRDLRKAVDLGNFRADLYYRLHVFDIHIPPLRERRNDILVLSEAFLQEIGGSLAGPPAALTEDARAALLRHDWPGNVRELRNALERAAILCEGGLITPDHLSLETSRPPMATTTTNDLAIMERQTIEQVLHETRWNRSKAARRLGLSRTQLYVRLRRHGLENPVMSNNSAEVSARPDLHKPVG
jgi:transcriptional regulator with GAF, ATPase, and Fis domain